MLPSSPYCFTIVFLCVASNLRLLHSRPSNFHVRFGLVLLLVVLFVCSTLGFGDFVQGRHFRVGFCGDL